MRNRTTIAALTVGLTLGFAAHAQAAEGTNAVTETTYAGVTVGIDPATGRLRPLTAAESKALSDKMVTGRQANAGSRLSTQPRTALEAGATRRVQKDGSVSIRVPSDQMSQVSAVVGEDGKVQMFEGSAPGGTKEALK